MKNTIKALAVLAIFAGGTAVIAAPAPLNTVTITALNGSHVVQKKNQCSAPTVTKGKPVTCKLGSNATILLNKGACVLSMENNKLSAKACKAVNSIKGNSVVLK